MTRHLYHTEGLIIKRREIKEADSLLLIFTKDFGCLTVLGRSIRTSGSKLRPHALGLNYVNLSLVRGKNIWRLAALENAGVLNPLAIKESKLLIIAKITNLLARLMPGEEENISLYHIVKNGFKLLLEINEGDEFNRNFEFIMILRILKSLGYFNDHSILGRFTADSEWTEAIVSEMTDYQPLAVSAINSSFLSASL